MSETDPTPNAEAVEREPQQPTQPAEVDWQAEAEKWKSLSRKHESTAKANAAAAKELEQFRASQMSETEKAVAAAKAEGFTEGQRRVSESAAMAMLRSHLELRGVEAAEQDELLEPVTPSRFLTEDGDVDFAKVRAYASRIAPEKPASSFPDLGQGRRGSGAKTTDMNQLIRQAAGRS